MSRRAILVLALAGFALLLAWGFLPEAVPLRAPTPLEPVTPIGPVAELDIFHWEPHWNREMPAGSFYRVVVHVPDAGDPPLISDELLDSRWEPAPRLYATWPDQVEWEVTAHEGGVEVARSARTRAWRSR